MKSVTVSITASLMAGALALAAPAWGQDAEAPPNATSVDDAFSGDPELDPDMRAALAALDIAPVFDGHNDLPLQLRRRLENQINRFDFTDTLGSAKTDPFGRAMHTDLKRLRKGRVGAQYWSVYVPASLPEPQAVQMTMEQIDVTKRLISRFPDDMAFAQTADQVDQAMADGKIA